MLVTPRPLVVGSVTGRGVIAGVRAALPKRFSSGRRKEDPHDRKFREPRGVAVGRA